MADLDFDALAKQLRKQRHSIDEDLEATSSRSAENSQLLEKLAELRRRAEKTEQAND